MLPPLERQELFDRAETKDLIAVLMYRDKDLDDNDCRRLGLLLSKVHKRLGYFEQEKVLV